MDGVIYHGNRIIPHVKEFVDFLAKEKKDFLFILHIFLSLRPFSCL